MARYRSRMLYVIQLYVTQKGSNIRIKISGSKYVFSGWARVCVMIVFRIRITIFPKQFRVVLSFAIQLVILLRHFRSHSLFYVEFSSWNISEWRDFSSKLFDRFVILS